MKHLPQIKLDYAEAMDRSGPEKRVACQKVLADLNAFEKHAAFNPEFGRFHDMVEMRELIGKVTATLNRLKS